MNGVLVVDKPAGPSSHDVVARVRRALGTPAVGHTGTLDPLATGVLPLVIGKATRLAQFLVSDEKEYLADVRFGVATPTYDAEERPAAVAIPGLTSEGVEALLGPFRGTYRQTPPPFSAKKVAGKRAYHLARDGKPVAPPPVEVHVSTLDLVSFEAGLARLRVIASSGFYVRVLAHDLGQRAGCGAHLSALRRVRAGQFALGDAVALDVVEHEGERAAARLLPMDRLLAGLPSVVLTERGLRRAGHGNSLVPGDFVQPPEAWPANRIRLLDSSGGLFGIAEPRPGGVLHPCVVLG
jgi:tRNA pseudouridine55 synthase